MLHNRAHHRVRPMVGGTGLRTGAASRFRSSLRTSLFRNSVFLLMTSFLSYGLGFLFWLVVARLYPASDVGVGATLLSTLLFLAGAATLGLPIGMIRFLPAEQDKVGLINATLTISGIVSLSPLASYSSRGWTFGLRR